jgi:hypothetical protein
MDAERRFCNTYQGPDMMALQCLDINKNAVSGDQFA